MPPESGPHKKVGIIISVVVVLAVVAITIFLGKKPSAVPTADQQTSSESSQALVVPTAFAVPTPPPTGAVPSVAPTTTAYKNGSYSATGSYMSPGGEDSVAVSLTLANDIVTDVTVTPAPADRTSERYQSKFLSGYKQYVVGKNIADINLSKVSGSSLTPIGFNDALAQIKTQAKV